VLESPYHEPLLRMYYAATLPARKLDASRRAAEGKCPAMVLFYHRVADVHPNAWTISRRRFREQINWIRDRFSICSLVEAQRRIASGDNREPIVSLTFDDGYAENCDDALPWLTAEKIPFTYFVATRHMLAGLPFAHDLQAGRPLAPNTPDQIRALADDGAEIGAHTRTHADLGAVADPVRLVDEMLGSRDDLEQLIGRPVNYFAFPTGMPANLSSAAFRLAFDARFWGVCSAYGGYNFPGDDAFHVQRIHGDPGWGRFRNWLTGDPAKLRRQRAFDPGDYRRPAP
jgi:peptidoglycan/xylan/chitin deacetylase (PgdA/CDA1 family)